MLLQLVCRVKRTISQTNDTPVLNPCLKMQWIYDNWGGKASAEMVRGWVIEQVGVFDPIIACSSCF